MRDTYSSGQRRSGRSVKDQVVQESAHMLKIALLLALSVSLVMAMDYKECIGTYRIDPKATVSLLTSKITPENEKQFTEAIDSMNKEKDRVDQATFTLNAKSIEFMMDDGTGNVIKTIAAITDSSITDDIIEITTQTVSSSGGDDVSFKLYRHEKSLVLEAHDMPMVLVKR